MFPGAESLASEQISCCERIQSLVGRFPGRVAGRFPGVQSLTLKSTRDEVTELFSRSVDCAPAKERKEQCRHSSVVSVKDTAIPPLSTLLSPAVILTPT